MGWLENVTTFCSVLSGYNKNGSGFGVTRRRMAKKKKRGYEYRPWLLVGSRPWSYPHSSGVTQADPTVYSRRVAWQWPIRLRHGRMDGTQFAEPSPLLALRLLSFPCCGSGGHPFPPSGTEELRLVHFESSSCASIFRRTGGPHEPAIRSFSTLKCVN